MGQSSAYSPSFGTVLIRRKTNERPSELELRLRPLCGKIRIVEKLAGNAHILVPGSPTLAIRIYTTEEITNGEQNIDDSGDVDGLQHFRDSFEHSLVFFVLPRGEEQNQLSRRESFVNAAQQALLTSNSSNGKKRSTRTLIVPDATQAINAVASVLQSMGPEKREKKKQYFAQIANEHYLPNKETGKDPTQAAIANHVSKTFHEWSLRMGLPDGDSNVMMDLLGTLSDIATADEKTLNDLPIRSATKASYLTDILSTFFGSSKANASSNADDKFDTGSIASAFEDNIDDNEFLQIPDPGITQTVGPPAQSTNPDNEFGWFEENSYSRVQPNFNPHCNQRSSGPSYACTNFPTGVDFTPIQPPYQANYYHPSQQQYHETPSVIPHSFAWQNNFTPHSTHRGYGYTPGQSFRGPTYHARGGNFKSGYDPSAYQQF